jgi:phosphoribosylglycinamide formyltransferase-1
MYQPVLNPREMKIVILGSGRGSNAEALLLAQASGQLGTAGVAQILSDKFDAGILLLGPRFSVTARFLDPGPFKTKFDEAGETRYIDEITALAPDLIVLAGFMRILRPRFIDAFPRKIINLHPSLLPSFPGLDGIGQAWRRGVKISGCTVHYVTAEVDGGPIIDQEAVRIESTDTLATLEAKIHAAEHRLLPTVIAQLSKERAAAEGVRS